jgi:hypothetical protein
VRRIHPQGLLMDPESIGPLARSIQNDNPPWRVGVDLQSYAWVATRSYSLTCDRWVYATDLLSLALRLRRLRGENLLP